MPNFSEDPRVAGLTNKINALRRKRYAVINELRNRDTTEDFQAAVRAFESGWWWCNGDLLWWDNTFPLFLDMADHTGRKPENVKLVREWFNTLLAGNGTTVDTSTVLHHIDCLCNERHPGEFYCRSDISPPDWYAPIQNAVLAFWTEYREVWVRTYKCHFACNEPPFWWRDFEDDTTIKIIQTGLGPDLPYWSKKMAGYHPKQLENLRERLIALTELNVRNVVIVHKPDEL